MHTFPQILHSALWSAVATAQGQAEAIRGHRLEAVMGRAAIAPADQLDVQITGAYRASAVVNPQDGSTSPLRMEDMRKEAGGSDIFFLTGEADLYGAMKTRIALVGNRALLLVINSGGERSKLSLPFIEIRFSGTEIVYSLFDGMHHMSNRLVLEPLNETDTGDLLGQSSVAFNRDLLEGALLCFKSFDQTTTDLLKQGPLSREVMLRSALAFAACCERMDPVSQSALVAKTVRAANAGAPDPLKEIRLLGSLAAVRRAKFAEDASGFADCLKMWGVKDVARILEDTEELLRAHPVQVLERMLRA